MSDPIEDVIDRIRSSAWMIPVKQVRQDALTLCDETERLQGIVLCLVGRWPDCHTTDCGQPCRPRTQGDGAPMGGARRGSPRLGVAHADNGPPASAPPTEADVPPSEGDFGPLWHLCTDCGGRGYTDEGHWSRPCPHCHRVGFILHTKDGDQ